MRRVEIELLSRGTTTIAATAAAMLVVLCTPDPVRAEDDSTLVSLYNNVLSYFFLIIPAAIIIRTYKKHPERLLPFNGLLAQTAKACVFGGELEEQQGDGKDTEKPKGGDIESGPLAQQPSMLKQGLKLLFCVVGLQGSYLTWGVLQELIMTRSYGVDDEGKDIFFKNSQFLVFVNRILALVTAAIVIKVTQQPPQTAATYRYSFASMSNVMSSWCQYEALKYVSFPTQVLAKSGKIIPVMIMGKFVQNKTYPLYEYGCALVLSIGVALFMFSKAEEEGIDQTEKTTSLAGLLLLLGYLIFDSFTSNYQSHLFQKYKMSSYQMMLGVNIFSCIFTVWSLIRRGTFMPCIEFMFEHPSFMVHAIILSITSASGQMFIFYTLSTYGALVFSIIMTTRQVISIFLSALVFGHSFGSQGWLGVAIVFAALFGRIYLRQTLKKAGK